MSILKELFGNKDTQKMYKQDDITFSEDLLQNYKKQFEEEIEKNVKESLISELKLKEKKLEIEERWNLDIYFKNGKYVGLMENEYSGDNIPQEYYDCLKWFLYRKSSGYELTYNKGKIGIVRDEISSITIEKRI